MKKSRTISKKVVGAKVPAFPSAVVVISSDADLHARLAIELADGAKTFGDLRRKYDISPLRLEFECIERFSEAYLKGSDERGRPTIALRPDRPPLDVMLDRAPLLAWIAESGPSGIYLATLHKHTGLTSVRIEELLAEVEGIERLVRDNRVLFKMIPNAILSAALRKAPTDPAILRDQLIALCGQSTRHLSWLELAMERHEVLKVLSEFSADFGVDAESLAGGDKLIWVSSSQPAKKPLAETSQSRSQDVRPEAPGPLLEEVFSPQQLQELKHRPHAPGMGTRRMRRPLVNI